MMTATDDFEPEFHPASARLWVLEGNAVRFDIPKGTPEQIRAAAQAAAIEAQECPCPRHRR
jgi:hypothetical protein